MRQQQPLPHHQQDLRNEPAKWNGERAVPHGFNIQRNGTGQQLPLQMPTCRAYSQYPATRPTMQQQLASDGHGPWMNANSTPKRVALQRRSSGQQERLPHLGAHFVANNNKSSTARAHCEQPPQQHKQFYGADCGRMTSASSNASVSCAAQPLQQKAFNAGDFFSLSEQELDEVLASLADSSTTSQQKTPKAKGSVSLAAQFISPPGAAQKPRAYGNAPTAPRPTPTTGTQAVHIDVPAVAEVPEIRESSAYPGAYDFVTTAGTFMAYGQTPAGGQPPQRQPHYRRIAP